MPQEGLYDRLDRIESKLDSISSRGGGAAGVLGVGGVSAAGAGLGAAGAGAAGAVGGVVSGGMSSQLFDTRQAEISRAEQSLHQQRADFYGEKAMEGEAPPMGAPGGPTDPMDEYNKKYGPESEPVSVEEGLEKQSNMYEMYAAQRKADAAERDAEQREKRLEPPTAARDASKGREPREMEATDTSPEGPEDFEATDRPAPEKEPLEPPTSGSDAVAEQTEEEDEREFADLYPEGPDDRQKRMKKLLEQGGFTGGIKAMGLVAAGKVGLSGVGAATIGGMSLGALSGAASAALSPIGMEMLAAGKAAQKTVAAGRALTERTTATFGEGAYLADPLSAAATREELAAGFAGRAGTKLHEYATAEARRDQRLAEEQAMTGFDASRGRLGAVAGRVLGAMGRAYSTAQLGAFKAEGWVEEKLGTIPDREKSRAGRRAMEAQEALTGRPAERTAEFKAAEALREDMPGIFGEWSRGMTPAATMAGAAGTSVTAPSSRMLPQDKVRREWVRQQLMEIYTTRMEEGTQTGTVPGDVSEPTGRFEARFTPEHLRAGMGPTYGPGVTGEIPELTESQEQADELIRQIMMNQNKGAGMLPGDMITAYIDRRTKEMQAQLAQGLKDEAEKTRKEIKHAQRIPN